MPDIGGVPGLLDSFGQVFTLPEFRVPVVALSSLLGMWFAVLVIAYWRRLRPRDLFGLLLFGFVFAVVIPQGLLFVHTSRPVPQFVAYVLAALAIVAPLVWVWAYWSVMYRVIAERYRAWRDNREGRI